MGRTPASFLASHPSFPSRPLSLQGYKGFLTCTTRRADAATPRQAKETMMQSSEATPSYSLSFAFIYLWDPGLPKKRRRTKHTRVREGNKEIKKRKRNFDLSSPPPHRPPAEPSIRREDSFFSSSSRSRTDRASQCPKARAPSSNPGVGGFKPQGLYHGPLSARAQAVATRLAGLLPP